jgi:poly-gamma-glutamate synthesis protein (capsule biosynthesis protein)
MDTLHHLRERQMTYAGAGADMGAARAPAFLDTAAGRVGLVACASTFATSAQAAASRSDMPGRPGISVLRHDKRYVVTPEQLEALREIDEALGTAAVARRRRAFGTPPEPESAGYRFLDGRFEAGERPGVRTTCNVRDKEAIIQAVADARRRADLVVVSLHGHEGQAAGGNDDTIADFIVEFAHGAIEAGADVFLGHGPHRLHGVEIYRGRPIFYSLGNFMYMSETVERFPAEMYEALQLDPASTPSDVHDSRAGRPGERPVGFHQDRRFWQSVLPVADWGASGLVSVRLYPLALGLDMPRPQRGLARLADGDEGREILAHLGDLSDAFGTRIETVEEDGRAVGVVRLDGHEAPAR